MERTFIFSLRTDTQLRFTLHFTQLDISFCFFVSQPVAFRDNNVITLTYNFEKFRSQVKVMKVRTC